MRIKLVTNVEHAKGLAKDAAVVESICRRMGHDAWTVHYQAPESDPADLVIAFEHAAPQHLGMRNWMIPNPEWWVAGYAEHADRFEYCLCKTRVAMAEMATVFPGRCKFVGFSAADMRTEGGLKKRQFLHVAGASMVRGTPQILQAWHDQGLRYPITIISGRFNAKVNLPGVTMLPWVEPVELQQLLNESVFHLHPTEYEGFGHALHESMSVGAVIASTDAPPMNEWTAAARIPTVGWASRNQAEVAVVDAAAIATAARELWGMSDAEVSAAGQAARDAYISECAAFTSRLTSLLDNEGFGSSSSA